MVFAPGHFGYVSSFWTISWNLTLTWLKERHEALTPYPPTPFPQWGRGRLGEREAPAQTPIIYGLRKQGSGSPWVNRHTS